MHGVMVVLAVVGLLFTVPVWAGSAEEQTSSVVTYVTSDMREKCTVCHRIGRVLAYRLDRAAWITIVWYEMRAKQPDLFADYSEAEPMIDFLTAMYSF